MKVHSLTRRLLASAVGLTFGVVGAVALATPAQATWNGPHKTESFVDFVDDCDGTWVHVNSGSGYGLDVYQWTITLENGDPIEFDVPAGDSTSGEVPSDAGLISVNFAGSPYEPWTHTWVEPEECKVDEEPPVVDFDLLPLVGCDLVVFAIRNTSEEGVGLLLSLTANQDATHGHAPAFIPLLDVEPDDEGLFEAPEDAELVDPQEVGAGETVTLGPFAAGAAHAHGFEAAEGLVVTADVLAVIGEEDPVSLLEEPVVVEWSEEGLDCEDGEGGELPETGISTGLIALGAVVLLALGGGLYLVARRRRVTFTA